MIISKADIFCEAVIKRTGANRKKTMVLTSLNNTSVFTNNVISRVDFTSSSMHPVSFGFKQSAKMIGSDETRSVL